MSSLRDRQEMPPICDYEGSDYRTRFWEDQDRDYEDLAERIAVRRLLPPQGQCLLEIGTGFGRLVDLYQGYQRILLLDYSKSLLREAQGRLGRDPRYTYLAADLYRMPLIDSLADTVSMVRVMHHVADVEGALAEIRRVIRPGGTFLLEFASKRHLKAIARYLARRQEWNPFDPAPVEFVSLNYDFHPRWMRTRLQEQGFDIQRTRTVSHFRVPLLKRLIPARALAALDGAVQWTGQWWMLTPSIFMRAAKPREASSGPLPGDDPLSLFRCPACTGQRWREAGSELRCGACGARWAIDDGIYDFKDAI